VTCDAFATRTNATRAYDIGDAEFLTNPHLRRWRALSVPGIRLAILMGLDLRGDLPGSCGCGRVPHVMRAL
jgi:hypothetical protein